AVQTHTTFSFPVLFGQPNKTGSSDTITFTSSSTTKFTPVTVVLPSALSLLGALSLLSTTVVPPLSALKPSLFRSRCRPSDFHNSGTPSAACSMATHDLQFPPDQPLSFRSLGASQFRKLR